MPDTVTINTNWIKGIAFILAFVTAIGSWTFIAGASYEQLEKAQTSLRQLESKYDRLERQKYETDLALANVNGKLSLIELRLSSIEKSLDRLSK